jgi:DNA-binding CsgD family transcriptional regulator
MPALIRLDTQVAGAAMDATMDEVSSVIRLVREVSDLWDDPSAWREQLLHGACKLLNGHVGLMLADYEPENGWFGSLAVTAVVGLPEQLKKTIQPAFAQMNQRQFEDVADNLLPAVKTVQDHMERQGWVTTAMSHISDDESYHASPWYQDFRKEIDCDDNALSIRVVDVPRRPELISIDRPHGAPPFGAREVTLLKLLHDEIAPLVGVRLTTEEHLSRDGLSKRLRETLSLLLKGQSEKQVASSLNLATRTVHDYVTRLYEHFRVSSRAELLAYFIRRTPVPRNPVMDGAT